MKKLIPLFLVIVLTLCSCLPSYYENVDDTPKETLPAPQSVDELYSLYSVVDSGMTKEDLDSRFGEPTPSYDEYGEVIFYTYFNETKSAGVSVAFDPDNKVLSKTLYFNTKWNLVPFSGRYISEKIPEIKTDMFVEAAIDEMGSRPLELSHRYGNQGPEDAANIYCWYNEDGSNFMIHTKNGLIENVALYRN